MDFVIEHSYLIPLLPLIGAAAAGFFGARHLRHNSHWPIWIGVGASAVLSIVLLLGMLGRWGELGHGGEGGHGGGGGGPAVAEPAGAEQVGSSEDGRPLYNSQTLGFRRRLYTGIRAGERKVPQTDAAGHIVTDNNDQVLYTSAPAFVADAA